MDLTFSTILEVRVIISATILEIAASNEKQIKLNLVFYVVKSI